MGAYDSVGIIDIHLKGTLSSVIQIAAVTEREYKAGSFMKCQVHSVLVEIHRSIQDAEYNQLLILITH